MKKLLLFGVFLCVQARLIGMFEECDIIARFNESMRIKAISGNRSNDDGTINYHNFYALCRAGALDDVKFAINARPDIDINHQEKEDGEAALLHAASTGNWSVVWYLLEACGANKMAKDAKGKSLLSYALHLTLRRDDSFQKLLDIYSPEQLHELCKTERGCPAVHFLKKKIKEVLVGKRDLESNIQDVLFDNTALYHACMDNCIHYILQLLEHGAQLEKKEGGIGKSPYLSLNTVGRFVVRERLNVGLCGAYNIPAKLMETFFENIGNTLNIDIMHLIKKSYIEQKIAEGPCLSTPFARMWKFECDSACKIAKIEEEDEAKRFTALLVLPQTTLTEINIALAKEEFNAAKPSHAAFEWGEEGRFIDQGIYEKFII